MSFTIATDTSANLPPEIREKESVVVIPLSYCVRGKERSCLDPRTFRCQEYYDFLKGKEKVTTSQITPQKYIDYLEPHVKAGEDILFVGMSSGISGSFASARIAVSQLEEAYPSCRIRLVDSLGASMGEGLIVLRGISCRAEGKTLDETADFLESERRKLYQHFTVDDLLYLRRGGRLSNAAAIVGILLHIKPVLKGNEEGQIVVTEKLRGRKAVLRRLADKFAASAVHPETQTVAISHCNCPEDANALAETLKQNCGVRDVIIVEHEPVTGSYLGPGAIALYYFGDENIRLS